MSKAKWWDNPPQQEPRVKPEEIPTAEELKALQDKLLDGSVVQWTPAKLDWLVSFLATYASIMETVVHMRMADERKVQK